MTFAKILFTSYKEYDAKAALESAYIYPIQSNLVNVATPLTSTCISPISKLRKRKRDEYSVTLYYKGGVKITLVCDMYDESNQYIEEALKDGDRTHFICVISRYPLFGEYYVKPKSKAGENHDTSGLADKTED